MSNAPPVDGDGHVRNYAAMVRVAGSNGPRPVQLATAPVAGGCLISGFGDRRRRDGSVRPHRGIDIANPVAVPIYAAGDGTILEKVERDDFGRMLLIDHGGGVFTRYAHLATFARGTRAGRSVVSGETVGTMGDTGAAEGRHLHYEILTGDYANPKKSFGLTAHDVFKLPPDR